MLSLYVNYLFYKIQTSPRSVLVKFRANLGNYILTSTNDIFVFVTGKSDIISIHTYTPLYQRFVSIKYKYRGIKLCSSSLLLSPNEMYATNGVLIEWDICLHAIT